MPPRQTPALNGDHRGENVIDLIAARIGRSRLPPKPVSCTACLFGDLPKARKLGRWVRTRNECGSTAGWQGTDVDRLSSEQAQRRRSLNGQPHLTSTISHSKVVLKDHVLLGIDGLAATDSPPTNAAAQQTGPTFVAIGRKDGTPHER
jgi:hypothetical protein